MARGKYGETLQAVEININSFIGIATDLTGAGSQIHLLEDGDITFSFGDKDVAVDGLLAGMDLVAGPGCTAITSTATVIIS